MRVKVFQSRSRASLEETVNAWLERNEVSPTHIQFSSVLIESNDVSSYVVEHTLVLFYVPLHAI